MLYGRSAMTRAARGVVAAFAALALCGCAFTPTLDRTPPPTERYFNARVAGHPHARFYGDKPAADHAFDLAAFAAHRLPALRAAAAPGEKPRAHMLLLSGGGSDGVFGAGLLNGWTASGERPAFDVVTGVSIGALMAPYAFLGPDYDADLRAMFLDLNGAEDVFVLRLLGVLAGAIAAADTRPLERLIEARVTPALLDRVAAEHAKGRRLFVGTTYLDAKRPVTWNMGEIAASGRPDRLTLFRQILLASAAVPGLAPPVFIETELDGARYREMHVDGGVMNSMVFAAPDLSRPPFGGEDPPVAVTLWAVQNNRLRARYQPTPETLRGVVGDAVSELIRSQSRGDQSRIYFIAARFGFDYRLAQPPRELAPPPGEEFAPSYLRALFEHAEAAARGGFEWREAPPAFTRAGILDDGSDADTD